MAAIHKHQVRSALFGGGADPGDPDDQQNLHLHQVAETEFLLQHMASRRSGQGRVDWGFPRRLFAGAATD
jgi:hypothetical protein